MPRDPLGDGIYYVGSSINSYALVNDCENPEAVALLACCDRFKIIDPTVVKIDKKQLKEVYMWTDEMLDMYDTCYNLAVANQRIDLTGDLPKSLADTCGSLGDGIIRNSNPSSWAQLKEQNREKFDYSIEELNALIADYNESFAS